MTNPTSRMLELLSLLQTQRHWSGSQLAQLLAVTPRTIRRDVDRLRELGYPVAAVPGVDGGYRLQAGANLPPLLLDDDEAIAIAVGLRTAAGGTVAGIAESSVRALAKLDQVLPKRLRGRVQAVQTYTVPLQSPGPMIDADVLITLTQACRDRERLRFAYSSRDGVDSRRLVEPHGVVAAGRRWYLVAWDVDREDWRTFRVDRLSEPFPTGIPFDPRQLPAADVAEYVAQAIASTLTRYRAVVKLFAPAEVIRDRLHPCEAVVESIDAEHCLLRTGADSLEWLGVIIGVLGVDFVVHEPPELVDYVAAMSSRFVRAAQRPPEPLGA